jgi:hypothetical protein
MNDAFGNFAGGDDDKKPVKTTQDLANELFGNAPAQPTKSTTDLANEMFGSSAPVATSQPSAIDPKKQKLYNVAQRAAQRGVNIPNDIVDDFHALTALESGRSHFDTDRTGNPIMKTAFRWLSVRDYLEIMIGQSVIPR